MHLSRHKPILFQLSALLVEMQHETEGVQTFRQNFRALRDTSCKVNCKEREKNQKDGVPDAFWTTELIRWLKQVLNIECDLGKQGSRLKNGRLLLMVLA